MLEKTTHKTNTEVDILTKYLIGKNVKNEKIYSIYEHVTAGESQDRITALAFKNPWLIPFLDAGLVFVKKPSGLRRRIHIVFSSLESTPEFTSLFMAEKVNFFGLVKLILVGIRGVFRAVIGIIIVKAVRI